MWKPKSKSLHQWDEENLIVFIYLEYAISGRHASQSQTILDSLDLVSIDEECAVLYFHFMIFLDRLAQAHTKPHLTVVVVRGGGVAAA